MNKEKLKKEFKEAVDKFPSNLHDAITNLLFVVQNAIESGENSTTTEQVDNKTKSNKQFNKQ
jgi:hypothetical protein